MEQSTGTAIRHFRDLKSWQLARKITQKIYAFTKYPDFKRDFGLSDQVRRSSVSIMSNIAEGFERSGNREFRNFLSIAKGSCGELESEMVVAWDQRYISRDEYIEIVGMIRRTNRLIWGLMKHLGNSAYKGVKYK